MQTKINWFEIPASDFSRAVRFYEAVFEKKLRVEKFGGGQLGVFTNADDESFGGVMHGEGFIPCSSGKVIYLDASPAIDTIIARIERGCSRQDHARTAERQTGLGRSDCDVCTELSYRRGTRRTARINSPSDRTA